LVYILDDWEALEKYAGNLPGIYQVMENDGKIEVRVRIGDCGWQKEFATKKDPNYVNALDFCWKYCVKILGNTSECLFFKP
jgi:hypothetical protein